MLVVGLTGGIGSGKSAVANAFAKLGVPIIDTDVLAREVVLPKEEAHDEIIKRYGLEMTLPDRSLDRQKLRKKIVENPSEREWLEKLLHPKIRSLAAQKIKALTAKYCVLVVPLLIENLPYPLINRILVVDCSEALQISRTQQRDHASLDEIQGLMKAQVTRQQRLAAADDILVNDQDITHLESEVAKLHKLYSSI
jgi:dephospho-CoA kinase